MFTTFISQPNEALKIGTHRQKHVSVMNEDSMAAALSILARSRFSRTLMMAAGSCLASACATLPSNGPTGSNIRHDSKSADNTLGYKIIDITPQVIAETSVPMASDTNQLAALAAQGNVDTLGPGDALAVEIFEVGSGLFSNNRLNLGQQGGQTNDYAAQTPAANGQPIANGIVVDRDGYITVPYAGRINVAGLTTTQVQDLLTKAFSGKSQSPQVVVTLARNVANTVVIMGAVQRPGRFALSLAHEHLLDIVAEAGGIALNVTSGSSTATGTGPQDMIVRFTRKGHTGEQRLDSIESGGPNDLALLPNDRVEIIRRPRTLTMFGAISRISQLPFESQTLTLAEALARAGGPTDDRADPRSVFIFRLSDPTVPLKTAQDGMAGQPDTPAGSRPIATIYHLNMMKASSYFYAQQFAMREHDVLYVANSESNQPTKFVQILNLLFTPVYSVREAAR